MLHRWAERVPHSSSNKCSLVRSQTAERDICVCVCRVGSGHYTAYGSHEGRWYHFNDSTVTLTNEDAVRKAKAYILFYVERTEQVASDKTATNKPAVDTADMDSGPSEAAAQDKVAADTVLMDVPASHMNTQDVAEPDNAALENVGEDMAELHKADTVTSVEAATDRDTSEDDSQAIQAVAQWFCQTASDQLLTPQSHLSQCLILNG